MPSRISQTSCVGFFESVSWRLFRKSDLISVTDIYFSSRSPMTWVILGNVCLNESRSTVNKSQAASLTVTTNTHATVENLQVFSFVPVEVFRLARERLVACTFHRRQSELLLSCSPSLFTLSALNHFSQWSMSMPSRWLITNKTVFAVCELFISWIHLGSVFL